MEISQEDRNKAVLGTLIAWVYQSSIGILGRSEAEFLFAALDGSKDEELKIRLSLQGYKGSETNGNQ